MTDMFDAEDYVGRAIQAIPGRPPIAYPDRVPKPGLPRLVFQPSTVGTQLQTVDGSSRLETSEFTVLIDVEADKHEEARTWVRLITAALPVGALDPTGAIQVVDVSPRPRYPTDGFFSYPLTIRTRYFTA